MIFHVYGSLLEGKPKRMDVKMQLINQMWIFLK